MKTYFIVVASIILGALAVAQSCHADQARLARDAVLRGVAGDPEDPSQSGCGGWRNGDPDDPSQATLIGRGIGDPDNPNGASQRAVRETQMWKEGRDRAGLLRLGYRLLLRMLCTSWSGLRVV